MIFKVLSHTGTLNHRISNIVKNAMFFCYAMHNCCRVRKKVLVSSNVALILY